MVESATWTGQCDLKKLRLPSRFRPSTTPARSSWRLFYCAASHQEMTICDLAAHRGNESSRHIGPCWPCGLWFVPIPARHSRLLSYPFCKGEPRLTGPSDTVGSGFRRDG